MKFPIGFFLVVAGFIWLIDAPDLLALHLPRVVGALLIAAGFAVLLIPDKKPAPPEQPPKPPFGPEGRAP